MNIDIDQLPAWDLTVTIGGKDYATRQPDRGDDELAIQLKTSRSGEDLFKLGRSLLTRESAAIAPLFSVEQIGLLIVAVYAYRAKRMSDFAARIQRTENGEAN
jgi:hypothetical protein